MASHTLALKFSLSHPDLDPNEVTRRTGLQPTRQTTAGVLAPGRTRAPRHTSWELDSPAPVDNSSVEEQWQALEALLLPHAAFFKAVPGAHMVAIVEAIQTFPGLTVPASLMKFLTEVDAEMEFDCYITSEYVLQEYKNMKNK